MWRALALAVALACSAANAFACEDPYNIDGIVYYDVPAGTPSSALILDVEFEPATIESWRGGIIEARVRHVVQGNFTGDRVRVGIINSSCLYPFVYGTEGLIIGEMREGFESWTVNALRWPDMTPSTREMRLGFEGVWFQPKGESLAERCDRTGVDPIEGGTGVLTEITPSNRIDGDFDGDGSPDSAAFHEDEEGNLVVAVHRATQWWADVIWGGDITSLPRFAIRTAPPALYHTDCEAFGPDCGGAPATVTLTHDGIIVEGLEDHSRTLYYWSDGEFENVSIRE